MLYKEIKFEVKEAIAFLTLNRPEKRNSLTARIYEELGHVLDSLRQNEEVRVVILTGAGEKAFCAGIDLNFLKEVESAWVRRQLAFFQEVHLKTLHLPQPVIAALNGVVIGAGLELALACDLRIAAQNATFSIPEVRYGIIPDLGGTQLLPRLVGPSQAKRLILTGMTIRAEEALQIGLVDEVVPEGKALEKAEVLAAQILKQAPLAVEFAKRAINLAAETPLSTGFALEGISQAFCTTTKDKNEALAAFWEKRAPKFQGK